MKLSEIMSRRVVAANPNASCASLAQRMLAGFISGLPVVDADRKVIGVVTEFDILRALRRGRAGLALSAEEVMTREPICLEADRSVEEAIEIMTARQIIRVPVVRDQALVGVVSRSDILRAFVREEFQTIESDELDE